MQDLERIMGRITAQIPLIHFMTNYVTVNDCANMCFACHGSPIMADDLDEVEDIVSLCSALVLNIGTLNNRTIRSMLAAGRKANALGKPVIFDPVGAGASTLRNETVRLFLRELQFQVIKGNISEIKNLFGGFTDTKGVDAAAGDLVCEENLEESVRFARELSVMTGAVIAVTGPIDVVSTSAQTYLCRNGHPLMTQVTGTGCMLGGVIATFLAANQDAPLEAVAAAVAAMGVCGEIAYRDMEARGAGTNTYRSLIIDAMSRLTPRELEENWKLESWGTK